MRRFAERPETPSSLPRAVLADDHLMVMEGIAELLAERIQLVALAATGRALVVVLGGGTYLTPSLGAKMLGGFSVQRYRLTPKQEHILRLTGRGLRSQQIAARLEVSARTVEAHRYTLMQIFEVHSVVELAQRATHLGCLVACGSEELETT
jgi:DNA-binding NarL/FixJ family response regulator